MKISIVNLIVVLEENSEDHQSQDPLSIMKVCLKSEVSDEDLVQFLTLTICPEGVRGFSVGNAVCPVDTSSFVPVILHFLFLLLQRPRKHARGSPISVHVLSGNSQVSQNEPSLCSRLAINKFYCCQWPRQFGRWILNVILANNLSINLNVQGLYCCAGGEPLNLAARVTFCIHKQSINFWHMGYNML